MRVFVTGATGFVGSAVVSELIAAGHQVTGLARNAEGKAKLAALGAETHTGDLSDPAGLRAAAQAADGVVHAAFIHNTPDYEAAAVIEQAAVEAMLSALEGTDKPFVATSVTGFLPKGQLNTEADEPALERAGKGRALTETVVLDAAQRGVRTSVVRLPHSVHDAGDHGFIPGLIAIARATGMAAYPGIGSNRWAAVHRLDAAVLYRLALEKAQAGSRLHATADEGVPMREIAGVIARHLGFGEGQSIPISDGIAHFGRLAIAALNDNWVSSERTQALMGWTPVRKGLIADLDSLAYFP